MKFFTTQKLTRMGVTAGLYIILSLATMSFASGAVQLRVSEALTMLPLIFPETALGLFAGCLLSNVITGCAILDVVFGSLITFVSGVLTAVIGKAIKINWLKMFLGGLFPVLLNAFLLPIIWWFCYGQLEFLYIIQVALLLLSQAISVYAFGVPLTIFCFKAKEKGFRGFTD